jgi:hypothetical protein
MTKLTHLHSGRSYLIDIDADRITNYIMWYQPMSFFLLPEAVNNWADVTRRLHEYNEDADAVQVHIRGHVEIVDTQETLEEISLDQPIKIESIKPKPNNKHKR